jgi:hypothetical protein
MIDFFRHKISPFTLSIEERLPDNVYPVKLIWLSSKISLVMDYEGIYRQIPLVNDDTGVKIGDLSPWKAVLAYFFLSILLPVGLWGLQVGYIPSLPIMASYLGLLAAFWGGILYQLFRTDTIVLSGDTVSIRKMLGGLILQKTDYAIGKLSNLRLGNHHKTLNFRSFV